MSFEEIRVELDLASEPVRNAPVVAHDTAWRALIPPSVNESLETLGSVLNGIDDAVGEARGQIDLTHDGVEHAEAEYHRILPQNNPDLTHDVFYHVNLFKTSTKAQSEIAGNMGPEIESARIALRALVEQVKKVAELVALGTNYAETTIAAKRQTVEAVDTFIARNV